MKFFLISPDGIAAVRAFLAAVRAVFRMFIETKGFLYRYLTASLAADRYNVNMKGKLEDYNS